MRSFRLFENQRGAPFEHLAAEVDHHLTGSLHCTRYEGEGGVHVHRWEEPRDVEVDQTRRTRRGDGFIALGFKPWFSRPGDREQTYNHPSGAVHVFDSWEGTHALYPPPQYKKRFQEDVDHHAAMAHEVLSSHFDNHEEQTRTGDTAEYHFYGDNDPGNGSGSDEDKKKLRSTLSTLGSLGWQGKLKNKGYQHHHTLFHPDSTATVHVHHSLEGGDTSARLHGYLRGTHG